MPQAWLKKFRKSFRHPHPRAPAADAGVMQVERYSFVSQTSLRASLVAALMALLIALVAGCSDSVPVSEPEQPALTTMEKGEIRLGLAVQSLDRTFFTGMEAGALAQADAHGVALEIIDGRDDHATQAAAVADLLDRIDALLLSPVDSDLGTEIAAAASARGVPVVAVANQIGSVEEHGPQFVHPDTLALVTNDDVSMGRKAGAFVAVQNLAEPVRIAVLSGARGTANVTMRLDGFERELADLGVGYEIVSDIDGAWNADGGEAACAAFSELDVDLVFSMSDAMTDGCVNALHDSPLATIPVVSIGGNEAGIALLADGYIVGSVCQKPGDMGALAVDVAVEALTTGTLDRGLQFYETPLVTADSMSECVPQW